MVTQQQALTLQQKKDRATNFVTRVNFFGMLDRGLMMTSSIFLENAVVK